MNLVVFIQSCQANADKREWIRKTWKPMFEQRGASVFFSVGGYEKTHIHEDEIRLKVEDTYEYMFEKTMSMLNELVKFEWDFLLKTDDDVSFNVMKTYTLSEKIYNGKYDYLETDYIGAFSLYSRPLVNHILHNLKRDDAWNYKDYGYGYWEGLQRHLPKEIWNQVLPDDVYIKHFIHNSNMFKTLYHPQKFTDVQFYEGGSNYTGIHNIRDEKTFYKIHGELNNVGG